MHLPRTSTADVVLSVVPGTVWRHYKGNLYVVVGSARIEATSEVHVLYVSAKNPEVVPWSRPLKEWTQEIICPDCETRVTHKPTAACIVPRHTRRFTWEPSLGSNLPRSFDHLIRAAQAIITVLFEGKT